MRVSQQNKLIDAGITTVAELADHTGPVPDPASGGLGKFTTQAKLQVRQRDTGIPQFEIVDSQPLTLLPEPDPGDLFFDFEGDPLWTADGRDWGLEYLSGVLEAGGNLLIGNKPGG
jgi:predicted RecB family nuclease